MNLNSIWSALEESNDVLGDYAYPAIGKAAVYKYIPEYFPKDVGAVGGLVGMLGALGGFFLPPMFATILELTWLPQTTFFVLFIVTTVSYMWLHWTVVIMLQKASPALENQVDFKEVLPAEAQSD